MMDASEIMYKVGAAIIADPEYVSRDWDQISIVYNFENGRKNRYGYIFMDDGSWHASLPVDDHRAILNSMLELQAAMERETGRKWIKALVLINREDESLDIKFEYDDPKKWVINPGDLEASVAALRP